MLGFVSPFFVSLSGPRAWFRGFGGLAGKGFWAVMDQGTFAVANFGLNVLLARWLLPQDYGAFTVSYTIFLFLGSLQNGLFSEPMLVFGSGKYKDEVPNYLGALLYGHFAFGAAGSVLLLLGGLALALSGFGALSPMFLALAFVAPFVLLQWLVRQACYVRLQPRLAASAGAAYMVLIMTGASLLYWSGRLSGASVLAAMGTASLLVSAWLVLRLGVRLPPIRDGGFVRRVLLDHWKYGRWAVPTRVFTYIPGNIFYLILPIWGGLAASAGLRALMNTIMPVLQAYAALSTLMVPVLSRAKGTPEFGRLVRLGIAFFVGGAVLYWAFLGLTHQWIVDLLYGGRYGGQAELLWLLGLLPVTAGILGVFAAALRALVRPDRMFWAYALTTATAATLGVGGVAVWGLGGAVAGLLLSSCVTTVAAAVFYRRMGGEKIGGTQDASGAGRTL